MNRNGEEAGCDSKVSRSLFSMKTSPEWKHLCKPKFSALLEVWIGLVIMLNTKYQPVPIQI